MEPVAKHSGVRVRVLVVIVILCALILELACLAYMHLRALRDSSYTPPGSDSIFISGEVPGVSRSARLGVDTKSWITSLNSEYIVAEAEYIATEEGRRALEQQKRLEHEAFMQDMADLSEQQQKLQAELDAKAEAEIAAMGGIDATKGDVIYDPNIPSSAPPSAPPSAPVVPAISESPAEATAPPEESTTADIAEKYFGQFSAHMVCTCEQCLDKTEWANVFVGDCYILADSEYLPAGIQVILDSGSTATYPVKAAEEMVTGREILIFNPNHSEASGDPDLFPKITKKE